jgi:hypothetical protein
VDAKNPSCLSKKRTGGVFLLGDISMFSFSTNSPFATVVIDLASYGMLVAANLTAILLHKIIF